jgi:hypothetical protein
MGALAGEMKRILFLYVQSRNVFENKEELKNAP